MYMLVFHEKYHYYHIFVVAVNELKIGVPIKFKNVKIGQKPKAKRRKPKAKKGNNFIIN